MAFPTILSPGPTGLSASRPRRRRRRSTWSSASLTRRTRNCTAAMHRSQQMAAAKSPHSTTMISTMLLHPWISKLDKPNKWKEIQKYRRAQNTKIFSDQKVITGWSPIRFASTSIRARTCSGMAKDLSRTWLLIRVCRRTWTASLCSISNRTKINLQ